MLPGGDFLLCELGITVGIDVLEDVGLFRGLAKTYDLVGMQVIRKSAFVENTNKNAKENKHGRRVKTKYHR